MQANGKHARVGEGFSPSASRGVSADQRMHAELASSLEHLAEVSTDKSKKLSAGLAALAQKISSGHKLKPMVFRLYYQLVHDLVAEDFPGAEARLDEMERLGVRSEDRVVTYFGHPDADTVSLSLIEDGMRIAPIDPEMAKAFTNLLGEGYDLLNQGLPELHGEIDSIVKEVLLARAPQGDKMEFDGASHYQFWGLLMLNPKHHKTPLEVVEVLAHEASHSLLFGLTIDEPLVLNDDDELFESPLRIDPRPMDGIYHATYVSARMCWAMENMASSGLLSEEDVKKALDAAAQDRENYEKGMTVINAHGRLSDSGSRILGYAQDWINQSA